MDVGQVARILRVQIKNNWVREAVYRTNFLTGVVVDLVWIGVELTFFSVIYDAFPNLAGWTRPQVYFFLGIFFASDALFTTFFQRNFWSFSDLVNRGELDIILTKPAPPLVLALTRFINLTSLFNFGLGLAVAAANSSAAGFPGGWMWLSLILWLGVGLISQLVLRFFFSIWVFWTDRSWAISRMYYQFFSIATKPDTLFPPMIRYTILTVLPFAFIGSVPARALLHGLRAHEVAGLVIVITAFFFLDRALWRAGLKRYQSASS